MYIENLSLGIPEKAMEMIKAGAAYRDGGIVRELNTNKIVAFLQDADHPIHHLGHANVVPLAVMGMSIVVLKRYLEKVENRLIQLAGILKSIQDDVKFANHKLDSAFFGDLLGALQSCHMEISENKTERFSHYRQCFLSAYHHAHSLLKKSLNDTNILKKHEDVLQQYYQAMVLAGIAARDISYRMGKSQSAREIAVEMAKSSEDIFSMIKGILNSPSSLFWQQPKHLEFAHQIKESTARLKSHEEMLRLLPMEEINKIIERQVTDI